MELNERKEFFRQLGLPRHEVYEWSKRSLEIPNFNLGFYRNRRHELRSKRISQEKVDTTIVEEIKEKYRNLLKSGTQKGSRNLDRSMSREKTKRLVRSERSKSKHSGRGSDSGRGRRPTRTPSPPIISNSRNHTNRNEARARSRSPLVSRRHDDEPGQQNWIVYGNGRRSRSPMHRPDNANDRRGKARDVIQQSNVSRSGNRRLDDQERSEMRLLYEDEDRWPRSHSENQQIQKSHKTHQKSPDMSRFEQQRPYFNELERSSELRRNESMRGHWNEEHDRSQHVDALHRGNRSYRNSNERERPDMLHFEGKSKQCVEDRFGNRQPEMPRFGDRNANIEERFGEVRFQGSQERLDETRFGNHHNEIPRFRNQNYQNLDEENNFSKMRFEVKQEYFDRSSGANQKSHTPRFRNQTILNSNEGDGFQNNQNRLVEEHVGKLNSNVLRFGEQRGSNFNEQNRLTECFKTDPECSEVRARNQTDIPRFADRTTMGFGENKVKTDASYDESKQIIMPRFDTPRDRRSHELEGLDVEPFQANPFRSGNSQQESKIEHTFPSSSQAQAAEMPNTFVYRTAAQQRKYVRDQRRKMNKLKNQPTKRNRNRSARSTEVNQNVDVDGPKKNFESQPDDFSHISKRLRLRKNKPREFWESWWKVNGMVEKQALKVSDDDPDLLSVINVLTFSNPKMNTKYIKDCEKAILDSLNKSSQVGRCVDAYDFLKGLVISTALTPAQVSGRFSRVGRRTFVNIQRVTKNVDLWYYCVALIGMWKQAYQASLIPNQNHEAALNLIQRDKVFNWLVHLAFEHVKLISTPILHPQPMEKQLQDIYNIVACPTLKVKHQKTLFVRALHMEDPTVTLLKIIEKVQNLLKFMPNPLNFNTVLKFMVGRILLSDKDWDGAINDHKLLKRKDDFLTQLDREPNVKIFEKYLLDTLLCIKDRLEYYQSVHRRLRMQGAAGTGILQRFLNRRKEFKYVCKWILEKRVGEYHNFEGVESQYNPKSCQLVVENKHVVRVEDGNDFNNYNDYGDDNYDSNSKKYNDDEDDDDDSQNDDDEDEEEDCVFVGEF